MSDIAKAAGISRQALYLHFASRTELLIATTNYIDRVKNVDARLAESRAIKTGLARLDAYVTAWCNYIPEIHSVSVALRAMRASDVEAAAAWEDRMKAVRHGCAAVVEALAADGKLKRDLSKESATDLLWVLLSVENWERLVGECGWDQETYIWSMKTLGASAITANYPDE